MVNKNQEPFDYSWLNQGEYDRYVPMDQRKARQKEIAETQSFCPLNGFFPDFMRHVASTSETPAIYILASALGLLGHAINRRAHLAWGEEKLFANLYTLLIGPSTIRKSYTIAKAKAYLDEIGMSDTILPDSFTLPALAKYHGEDIKEGETTDMAFKRVEDGIRAHQKLGNPEYRNGVMLFYADELASLLSTLSQKVNCAGDAWLTTFYSGQFNRWDYVTKQAGAFFIYRPIPSVLAASTPEWLENNMSEDNVDGGFLARWLTIHATKTTIRLATPVSPDDIAKQAKERALATLYEIIKISGEIGVRQEATDYYWKWHASLPKVQKWQCWLDRLTISARKIAMIYQMSQAPYHDPVSLDSMIRATRFIEHIWDNVKDLTLAFSDDEKLMRKLLDIIKKAGKEGITQSWILRSTHKTRKQVYPLLETLADREEIRMEEAKTQGVRWYAVEL